MSEALPDQVILRSNPLEAVFLLVAIVVLTALTMGFGWAVPNVGDEGELPSTLPQWLIPDVPYNMETLKLIAPFVEKGARLNDCLLAPEPIFLLLESTTMTPDVLLPLQAVMMGAMTLTSWARQAIFSRSAWFIIIVSMPPTSSASSAV